MQLNAQLKLAFAAAAYLKYLTLLHNVTRWPVLQQLNAQLKLAFAAAAYLKYLTLLHNVTRWPVLQKVRGHTRNVLPHKTRFRCGCILEVLNLAA